MADEYFYCQPSTQSKYRFIRKINVIIERILLIYNNVFYIDKYFYPIANIKGYYDVVYNIKLGVFII